jgi:diguanylate cyclase (GGDEF)-like protein
MTATPCDDCRTELDAILETQALSSRFSPIAALRECVVSCHLGTVSGPSSALLHSADRLFDTAVLIGQLPRLWRQSLSVLIGHYAASGIGGLLFVPFPASAVVAMGDELTGTVEEVRGDTNLPASRLAMVMPLLSWQATADDRARVAALAEKCRRLGYAVAVASLDCDATPGNEAPQFVLLDEEQLDGFDPDMAARGRLLDELAKARERGTRVVARGIHGQKELRVAGRLGVDLVAGDFIGRPNSQPARILSAAAYKLVQELVRLDGTQPPEEDTAHLLHRLKIEFPPVTAMTPSEVVFDLFGQNPQLRSIAVVDGPRPIGLISRYEMIDNMARPYRHELYGRRPCTRFMDREPIVVDIRMSLQDVTDILVHADPRHLVSGFIITDREHYAGTGSVQDLMSEITAMQIEAARYANPLTQLPGSVPINQHIDNLIAAAERFTICYCDLDHFKPFNDVYGYAKGDQMIALTARILGECTEPDTDFVGHIGGDDFVLVMRSVDWDARCRRALKLFEEEIMGFFSHDDIERGGYVTENRKGHLEFHDLTSLSIGVVEVAPGQFANHLQVAGVAAEVKRQAKAIRGNSMYVNRRRYEGTDATDARSG